MADLSNGYTKVANEIQQLKPRLRMSGREWQCFEAVIWLTYGWNKKQDLELLDLVSDLGIPVRQVGHTTSRLFGSVGEIDNFSCV